ncbi:hypothetical protein [Micromonospora schwarzwaldensis]|uniref:hypothetical protein n=1 Tax=Micromonospora sp. DSM 45708 TaxID=3111767 RepID=UPI0031E1BCC0
MKIKMRAALQAVVVGGALALAVATPAQAKPSNCQGSYDINGFNTWSVVCFQGTGQYRAKARCYSGDTNYRTTYGTWKDANTGFSIAYCSGSEDIASGTWELR